MSLLLKYSKKTNLVHLKIILSLYREDYILDKNYNSFKADNICMAYFFWKGPNFFIHTNKQTERIIETARLNLSIILIEIKLSSIDLFVMRRTLYSKLENTTELSILKNNA